MVVHQALLSVGFPRQEYWNGLPLPSSGDLPDPEIEPTYAALTGGFFTTELLGKPDGWLRLLLLSSVQFSSVTQLCPTRCNPMDCNMPGFKHHQNSRSLLKLRSIELVMPFNHLILCCSLLLLPSVFPSIRVFSSESVLRIRWPKYWSCSFSISTSNTRYQTNLSLSERGGGAGGEIMAAVTINCP